MTSYVTHLPRKAPVLPVEVDKTLWINPERTRQTVRCPAHPPADRAGWSHRTLTGGWSCEVCLPSQLNAPTCESCGSSQEVAPTRNYATGGWSQLCDPCWTAFRG